MSAVNRVGRTVIAVLCVLGDASWRTLIEPLTAALITFVGSVIVAEFPVIATGAGIGMTEASVGDTVTMRRPAVETSAGTDSSDTSRVALVPAIISDVLAATPVTAIGVGGRFTVN